MGERLSLKAKRLYPGREYSLIDADTPDPVYQERLTTRYVQHLRIEGYRGTEMCVLLKRFCPKCLSLKTCLKVKETYLKNMLV